jgi:hypothetical protein
MMLLVRRAPRMGMHGNNRDRDKNVEGQGLR